MLQAPEREKEIATMVAAYQKRRDALIAALQPVAGLKIFKPAGAFYLWCDISKLLGTNYPDDAAFAKALLDKKGLAVVPGSAFGAPGHIRMHFAAHDSVLAEAAKRLKEFVA